MEKNKKVFQFIVDLSTVILAFDNILEFYTKNYDKINLAVTEISEIAYKIFQSLI